MSGTSRLLGASLRRLHANAHPLGLASEQAEAFARALDAGEALAPAAARVGLDPRLAQAVATARIGRVPEAVTALLPVAATAVAYTRTLRAAAAYPLLLVVTIALSGAVVVGALAPALAHLPLGVGGSGATPLVAAGGGALLLLLLLSGLVLGRVDLPWAGEGWRRIEGYAFLASLAALQEAGASLPAAVRGAACWCRPPARRRAEALARALEAGREFTDPEALLDPFEASLLVGAARGGILPATLAALVEQRAAALAREVPAQTVRLQVAALALAGSALLLVGAAFFSLYTGALGG
ncbi:MAG: type II secretion system F family protein [Pseudomonadota bacterium]